MPRFSANLGFLYPDRPLLAGLEAVAKAGFHGVECMSPYGEDPDTIQRTLTRHSLTQALFNTPPGDWGKGERGLAALAGRDDDFSAAIAKSVKYAVALGCPRINVMAGIRDSNEPAERTNDRLVERLGYAADMFAPHGLNALLEPINPFDMPGYAVNTPYEGLAILERVNRPNARLQYDFYHAQRTVGELTRFLREHLDIIDHIQLADNPGRNQPGTGEINYRFLLEELDRLGYAGWVGLEYKPLPDADRSFGWITEMGFSR